jgi:hypothetical protein
MRNRLARRGAIALAAIFLGGCFELPVDERMEISFEQDGVVTARVDVVFSQDPQRAEVRERLATVRQQYVDSRDPWTARFARTDPKHETYFTERAQGELVRVERSARINPDRIADLFFDTSVSVSHTERDGIAELSFYAGTSGRATKAQEREFHEVVESWSRDVTAYLQAMDDLYRYLDVHPDRATVVFNELVGPGPDSSIGEPNEEEIALLDPLSDAADRVTRILTAAEGRAYSFEEISMLVNDPFPSEVTIHPAGAILELEGFERIEGGESVRVPRASLWGAFDSLRDRWISPDPIVALVEKARVENVDHLSPQAFAEIPRRSNPPRHWTEVRDALEARLRNVSTFRVTWLVR